jgi:MoxR-like ATPase
MTITIPDDEVALIARQIETEKYDVDERRYKVALHEVLSRLLSAEVLDHPRFPDLLKHTLSAEPDYEGLGLADDERTSVEKLLQGSGFSTPMQALANVSGGRWGLAQFIWIPRAVDHDLGSEVRAAFAYLVDGSKALTERVDGFRSQLYEVQKSVRDRGGFEPNWNLLQVSLSFVGAIMGGFDPTHYTFYAAAPLRRAAESYGLEWPKGTAGERYERICSFVIEVFDALREAGVPVRDLIDAQSFLWLMRDQAAGMESPPSLVPMTVERRKEAYDRELVAAELARRTYWDIGRAKKLVDLTGRAKQLLFQGPPGTGKTFVAETLARLIAGEEEGRVEVIQFHPSYAYEDFVEGIRPRLTGEDAIGFEVRPGILKRLIDRAREFPEQQFFLIIDELNRANLPRVFGELLYALEYRGEEHPFLLPYSSAESYVPHNLWLIGTMNSADRSIALVDAAIRRRFKHVEFSPDYQALRAWHADRTSAALGEEAARRLEALNSEVRELLDEDRLIGHSFLMKEELNAIGFASVWEEDVAPVLREHLFNRPEQVDRLRTVFLPS